MTSLKPLPSRDEDSDRSIPPLSSQPTFRYSSTASSQSSTPSPRAWLNPFYADSELTYQDVPSKPFAELLASGNEGHHAVPSLDETFIPPERPVRHWARDTATQSVPDLAVPDAASCPGQSNILTLGDGTGEDEIVCYGMVSSPASRGSAQSCLLIQLANRRQIYRVMVKLEGDMLHLRQLSTFHDVGKATNSSILPVLRNEASHIKLQLGDGTCFAQVNARPSETLDELLQRPLVEMDAVVDHVQFLQTIDDASKPIEATMRVNINVYGSGKDREPIGKLLSDGKIFLQDPEDIRPGLRVRNPHLFELSGADHKPPETTVTMNVAKSAKDDPEHILLETVSNMYTALKRGETLKQIDGDACLRTCLSRHQREALDFMTQRESGPIPEEFRLWKVSVESGQQRYRHIVTNALSEHRPCETGGGVLADDTGLGKTLSVLALVAKTRTEAITWEGGPETTSRLGFPSRATLVVVPSFLVLNVWQCEIKQHLDTSFVVHKHHGPKREKSTSRTFNADIVLTTYFTLSAEMRSSKSPLCNIAWFRIVLDEAHIIRRRSAMLYHAVSELQGRYRWCVTSTPINNRLEDVGALLCHVGVPPFDRMSAFRRWISIPYEEDNEQRIIATKKLRLLFDSLCLRRTRNDVNGRLSSPMETVRQLEFSEDERKQYDATKTAMTRAIRQRVGAFDRNRFGMFQAQLQLRLLCNHGTFQDAFSWTEHQNMALDREVALELFGHTGEVNCSSCTQSLPIGDCGTTYHSWTASCSHAVCNECMMHLLPSDDPDGVLDAQICPICIRSGVDQTHRSKQTVEMQKQEERFFRHTGFSTKMNALVEDLRGGLWSSKRSVPSCEILSKLTYLALSSPLGLEHSI